MAKRGGSHNSPASKPELKSIVSFEPLTQWIEVGVYGQVFSLSWLRYQLALLVALQLSHLASKVADTSEDSGVG